VEIQWLLNEIGAKYEDDKPFEIYEEDKYMANLRAYVD
jgi:hypothetical protein